jgi:Fe-S-cluster containining protein
MSPDRVAELAGNKQTSSYDVTFVHENWTPISKEEAFAINPKLKANEEFALANPDVYMDSAEVMGGMHYYTCNKLDKQTGLCTAHSEKPHVCSGYPFYGRTPSVHMMFYSDDCGYIVDVEDEKARLALRDVR